MGAEGAEEAGAPEDVIGAEEAGGGVHHVDIKNETLMVLSAALMKRTKPMLTEHSHVMLQIFMLLTSLLNLVGSA